MARYAIHVTDSGTETARPVVGMIEISDAPEDSFAARLAEQTALLAANEALILLQDTAAFEDLDDDVNTCDYTVDTTATPPVAMTPVTVARLSLAFRQALHRARKAALLEDATTLVTLGRRFRDSELADWLTYLEEVKALPDAPADPDAVTWPAAPAETAGTDGDAIWTRLWRRGNTIGSVSRSILGVPNGNGLCDFGSTANGWWFKFTDGTLLIGHRAKATYNSVANLDYVWTFPTAPAATVEDSRPVLATMSRRNNSNANDPNQLSAARVADMHLYTNTQGSETSVQIVLGDKTSSCVSTDSCWVELFFFGRWD